MFNCVICDSPTRSGWFDRRKNSTAITRNKPAFTASTESRPRQKRTAFRTAKAKFRMLTAISNRRSFDIPLRGLFSGVGIVIPRSECPLRQPTPVIHLFCEVVSPVPIVQIARNAQENRKAAQPEPDFSPKSRIRAPAVHPLHRNKCSRARTDRRIHRNPNNSSTRRCIHKSILPHSWRNQRHVRRLERACFIAPSRSIYRGRSRFPVSTKRACSLVTDMV